MTNDEFRVTNATPPTAPAARYGLGVVLRKPYPSPDGWKLESGGWKPTARGTETRSVAWKDLPADLLVLVRRRAAEDAVAAALVKGNEACAVVTVPSRESVILSEAKNLSVRDPSARVGGPQDDTDGNVVVIHVRSDARLRWFAPLVNVPGFTFVERLVWLGPGATLEYHGVAVGADALREHVHVVLGGEGATAHVNTLFAGSADHQFDFGVTVEHRAPRTTSDLRAKGILGGKAQGVYRGLVRVAKNAVRSDGYQRCDALLLSPTAEVDPVPQLEVETNDVRCTHGVTVSHLNPEHLFYLQSRGMTEAAARDLLIEGFTGSMLASWPEGERAGLREAVRSSLDSFTKSIT